MKKKAIKMPDTAYQIFQFHQKQIHYPLMLSTFLFTTKSQFESNRTVRLLCDWLDDFKVMNQILKHKYIGQIPKILKNLFSLYSNQADIYVCLAPYYYEFYNQWKDLTELIATHLSEGKTYTLRFIWYLSFDFCEKLDAQRQFQFNVYLSKHFEKPLLKFENSDQMTFKPLLQAVRMINIQKDKTQFVDDAEHWAQKMLRLYEVCTVQSLKVEVLIEIIGCRSFLLPKPTTANFWIQIVDIFLKEIQKRLPNIFLTNQVDLKLLDWFTVIVHFEQIQTFLLQNKKRFLSSLISKMKKNPDPKNAFHYEKYYSLRNVLTQMFFFRNKEESIKEMEEILTQFNRKSFSILKDSEQNIQFFDCMCEMKLPITKTNINDIIKSLANGHSRKSFPVHVLIILVKVLHSASDEKLAQDSIYSIIKSLSESIAAKINDPDIYDLRLEISKYYITLANMYQWNDQKSTEIMLLWVEEFQRNNKLSTPETINLLRILTKKHKQVVFASFNHKLEGLITDITYKLKFNKVYNNIPIFVSLLLGLYLNVHWKMSHKFVTQICSENPDDITFLYLLQSQILIRETWSEQVKLEQKEIKQMKFIYEEKEMWRKSARVNVYLYCIEIFFSKISKQQAFLVLQELDDTILKLFNQMFEEGMYHTLIHLVAKSFFRVGSLPKLKMLKSYCFFKDISFDILSKSFHKNTVILMSYAYCMLINKADSFENFFVELNEQKFLNSLFQGCDQFIGKSPRFYHEQCYIVLMAMKGKENIRVSGHSSLMHLKEIQKNIGWWQETKYFVFIKKPQQQDPSGPTLVIEEFKDYYEQQVRNYFAQEVKSVIDKNHKPVHKENEPEQDNIDL